MNKIFVSNSTYKYGLSAQVGPKTFPVNCWMIYMIFTTIQTLHITNEKLQYISKFNLEYLDTLYIDFFWRNNKYQVLI